MHVFPGVIPRLPLNRESEGNGGKGREGRGKNGREGKRKRGKGEGKVR